MSIQVEVDIEFFDPKLADFHGIKTLLTDLLGGAPYDASQLADAVIAQVRSVALPPAGPRDHGAPHVRLHKLTDMFVAGLRVRLAQS